MKAQQARGVDLSAGPIKERLRAIIPLLIPLFISAFKRAEDLATAMEARGTVEERDGHVYGSPSGRCGIRV